MRFCHTFALRSSQIAQLDALPDADGWHRSNRKCCRHAQKKPSGLVTHAFALVGARLADGSVRRQRDRVLQISFAFPIGVSRKEQLMPVVKVVELIGTSKKSWEDAVQQIVKEASAAIARS